VTIGELFWYIVFGFLAGITIVWTVERLLEAAR